MDQGIRGFTSRLSHEAFPRGFSTGLSHVPPWCESILGLKVEAVLGKQVSLEWTEPSGGLWECGTTLEFLSSFLWRAPPLEMRRECRKIFPDHAGKGSLLPSCSSSVTLPYAWIKGSVAFPRGFPTRLSHEAFPQGCPTCHRGVSPSSA